MGKKNIDSRDVISEGTLHEILLDIKYRLNHLEDMEADNRALMVKMVKQSNSIVSFLNNLELEDITEDSMGMKLPPLDKEPPIDDGKIRNLKELIDEFMDRRKDLKEFEKELKKHKDMLTPGQMGEA